MSARERTSTYSQGDASTVAEPSRDPEATTSTGDARGEADDGTIPETTGARISGATWRVDGREVGPSTRGRRGWEGDPFRDFRLPPRLPEVANASASETRWTSSITLSRKSRPE